MKRSEWLLKIILLPTTAHNGSKKELTRSYLTLTMPTPASMMLAIENFAKMRSINKILVLGAMAELGETSLQEHQAIMDMIRKHNWADVILVGNDFEKLSSPFHWFKNSTEAGKWFQQQNFQNNIILIKGSRSMQMEKVAEQV